jgi:hypothetical protein
MMGGGGDLSDLILLLLAETRSLELDVASFMFALSGLSGAKKFLVGTG